jgi:hypothetical protein
MNSVKYACFGLLSGIAFFSSPNAQSAVFIGDPNAGGIAYHLDFQFDNPGNLSATTGQTLATIGAAGDRQDFNGDLVVDEVGVKSWRDSYDPDFGGPLPGGQYGWALNSRWSMIDLNGLAANGYTQAQVSITLQADATGTNGVNDLVPGITAWKGLELTNSVTGTDKWFPNASTSNNWNDWWASDSKQSALNGLVWSAADDSSNSAHSITLTLPWLALNGSNDFITLNFGGNLIGSPTQFTFANFKATVSVQAVPLPGAAWLFGSALAGFGTLFSRRIRKRA